MLEMLAYAWSKLAAREKLGLFGILLSRFVGNLFDLLGLAAIGLLVMAVASGKIDIELGPFGKLDVPNVSGDLIVLLVALAAGAFLVKAVYSLLLSLANVKFMMGIELKNSERIANHIFGGSLAGIKRFSNAEISYSVNASTNSMFTGLLGGASSLLTDFALAVMIVGAFILIDPVAAFLVLAYLAVMVVVTQLTISEKLRRIAESVRRASLRSSQSLLDGVNAFREIKIVNRQEFFLNRYLRARKQLAQEKASQLILNSVPRIIIEQGLMIGILGYVGWQVLGSEDLVDSLAGVGVFVVGSMRLLGAVMPIQNGLSSIRLHSAKAQMAREISNEIDRAGHKGSSDGHGNIARNEVANEVDIAVGRGLSVSLKDVSFSYPNSQEVIKNLSFEIPGGSFAALVGPSGAGKSTLADIILGLQTPSRGAVLVEDYNPSSLMKVAPGLISYVPQKPGMVSGSIARNVALGLSRNEIDEDRVWKSLEQADLLDVVSALPRGIHSSLGKQADRMSGGQLQRIGLARALYTKPKLIVLDEATSALDAQSEENVTSSLRGLGPETTLIVIAHRLSTVKNADCVFVIDHGEIKASGKFQELRKSSTILRHYAELMSLDVPSENAAE